MLRWFHNVVERSAPSLTLYYREVRDARAAGLEAQRFTPTRFGFRLAGPPYWADEEWEADEIQTFLRYLPHCAVCIDIGANLGYYSCLAASRGLPVIAIEPLAANLRLLYSNLTQNELWDVEVYPVGLSSKPGLKRMYGISNLASFVAGWAESSQTRFSVVPVTTLDLIAAPRFEGVPVFVKMDVEGFENEVLSGAHRTLRLSPKPIWLVEILLNDRAIPGRINTRFSETFEVFWRYGYQCRRAGTDQLVEPEDVRRWVERGKIDSGPRVSNFLFLQA